MHAEYHSRDVGKPEGLVKYIENNTNVAGKDILPYATIAARLFVEQGVKVLGKTVTIHSDVPVRQGYASSAVCSAAFTMALAKASGKRLEDQVAIDIIRDGERIVHKAETAGRIDVGPIYFGGFARFSAADGIKKEDISTPLNIVVIDTGPKPPTAEMVKKVRDLYNADTAGTTKTLKEIDNCVERATIALKEGNLRELGKLMSRNHELLNKLGVSSPGLDKAVAVAVSNGAYGAKLCGGGGGGMCIALVGGSAEADKVISALKAKGFNAYSVAITHNGANSNTSE
jgi:mevalonate kinase